MTTELYEHFSHFNFTAEQWQDAARRYLEIDKHWAELEDQDEEIDHDALAENFERCDICEEISEIQDARDEFAREFAATWAEKALAGEAGEASKRNDANAAIPKSQEGMGTNRWTPFWYAVYRFFSIPENWAPQ